MKKLTVQSLYESIIENQVPTLREIEDYLPDTDDEVITLVSDYWVAVDEVSNVRRRIRKIAQEKSNIEI